MKFTTPEITTIKCLCLATMLALGPSSTQASENEPFSIVLLPDTQLYTRDNPDFFLQQTGWVHDWSKQESVEFVIHLGDLVQYPDNEKQWKVADQAMAILDGEIPYTVVPGNHEMLPYKSPDGNALRSRDMPLFDATFPPVRFADSPAYGGHMGSSWANNYSVFEAGGMQFLVIGLEHRPRDESLAWASRIIKQHPNHRVIVATHWYLFRDGTRHQPDNARVEGNNGEEMWQNFVRKHEQIFLVVSGHIGVQEGARLTSRNDAGSEVHQILSDFQGIERGGNGYLRILSFYPDKNSIHVRTYSPVLDMWMNTEQSDYWLDYPMTE